MNTELKKLPVGIESFQEIRTEDFYYIAKTGLIRELLLQQKNRQSQALPPELLIQHQ